MHNGFHPMSTGITELRPITIQVPSDVADMYETATLERQQTLDALLGIWLQEAQKNTRPVSEIMEDASRQAHKSGLTEEKLKALLDA